MPNSIYDLFLVAQVHSNIYVIYMNLNLGQNMIASAPSDLLIDRDVLHEV